MREPFRKFIRTNLGTGFLLIACGLPGTGKTRATEAVSRVTGYPFLRSDLIRREVLKDEDIFDAKVAANLEKRRLVYEEMFRRAETVLVKSDGVILDATFFTQSLRRRAAAIAAKYKLKLVILQTGCPREVAIRRILARTKEDYVSSALTEQAYLNNKKQFEPVDLDDLKRLYLELSLTHLIVDTSHDSPEDWYITRVTRK